MITDKTSSFLIRLERKFFRDEPELNVWFVPSEFC